MAPISGPSIVKGTVKGAAWCFPGKGKGHSLYEFSTTAEFINGKVTFSIQTPFEKFTIIVPIFQVKTLKQRKVN